MKCVKLNCELRRRKEGLKNVGEGEASGADLREEEVDNRAGSSAVPCVGAPPLPQPHPPRNSPSSLAFQLLTSQRCLSLLLRALAIYLAILDFTLFPF